MSAFDTGEQRQGKHQAELVRLRPGTHLPRAHLLGPIDKAEGRGLDIYA